MTVTVNSSKIRHLIEARDLDITSLAQTTGVTRQTIHLLLRPGYQPFNKSLLVVAEALGVSPLALVTDQPLSEEWDNLVQLVEQTAQGNPRAFEMMPAQINALPNLRNAHKGLSTPLAHQLVAAASAMLEDLSRSKIGLKEFCEYHQSKVVAGHAFFFGAEFMATDRIVSTTPDAMKQNLVFGSFRNDDFERHFK